MRESEIRVKVELDEENVPEKIFWMATDAPHLGVSETKAMSFSVWDQASKETLRIDLWGKEFTTDEMKYFALDNIGSMANTIRSATGDAHMAQEMEQLCERLAKYLAETRNKQGK